MVTSLNNKEVTQCMKANVNAVSINGFQELRALSLVLGVRVMIGIRRSLPKRKRFLRPSEVEFIVARGIKGFTYLYEPRFFKLSDGTKYLPDFYCLDNDTYYEISSNMIAFRNNQAKYLLFETDYPQFKFEKICLKPHKKHEWVYIDGNHKKCAYCGLVAMLTGKYNPKDYAFTVHSGMIVAY